MAVEQAPVEAARFEPVEGDSRTSFWRQAGGALGLAALVAFLAGILAVIAGVVLQQIFRVENALPVALGLAALGAVGICIWLVVQPRPSTHYRVSSEGLTISEEGQAPRAIGVGTFGHVEWMRGGVQIRVGPEPTDRVFLCSSGPQAERLWAAFEQLHASHGATFSLRGPTGLRGARVASPAVAPGTYGMTRSDRTEICVEVELPGDPFACASESSGQTWRVFSPLAGDWLRVEWARARASKATFWLRGVAGQERGQVRGRRTEATVELDGSTYALTQDRSSGRVTREGVEVLTWQWGMEPSVTVVQTLGRDALAFLLVSGLGLLHLQAPTN
jgi:hypothetical protein